MQLKEYRDPSDGRTYLIDEGKAPKTYEEVKQTSKPANKAAAKPANK